MAIGSMVSALCLLAAYGFMFFVATVRGRSGRGDFVPLVVIAFLLLAYASYKLRSRFRWTMMEIFFSLVPLEIIVLACTAWISQDGSLSYLASLKWIYHLFDRYTLSYWAFLNSFIAAPWIVGFVIADLNHGGDN